MITVMVVLSDLDFHSVTSCYLCVFKYFLNAYQSIMYRKLAVYG